MSIRLSSLGVLIPLVIVFAAQPAFCQIAPLDASEPVTENAKVLSAVEDRDAAINLLEQSRRSFRPGSGGHPFMLRASFNATGQTEFEGAGTLQEILATNSRWRMTSQIGHATVVRLSTGTAVYGTSATEPVPLRLQLIWTAIFNPIPPLQTNAAMLRTADVNYKGASLTCVLSSGWISAASASRYYQERENCVDPQTHLLRVWSEKPGIYADYDYENAIDFHGNQVPRQISITEGGNALVVIHIDSVEDLTEAGEAALKSTPDLVKTFPVVGAWDFPIHVPPVEGVPLDSRVIVHASVSALDGTVVEAEAFNSANPILTRAAIEAVKAQRFSPNGTQREAFINVMFNSLPPGPTPGSANNQ